MNQEKFKFTAVIGNEAGEQKEVEFLTYWSPDKEGIPDEVTRAAAAQETISKKNSNGEYLHKWVPVAPAYLAA